MRRTVGPWLLAALAFPLVLAGQGVRGSVVDESGRPIANALVEVSTPSGEVVARGATTHVGTYLVRLASAGMYQLRVRAIGYAQVRFAEQSLPASVIELPVVRMMEAVPLLSEVVSRGESGRCRVTPETGRVMAPLLDAVGNALEVMEHTLSLGDRRHEVELVHRRAFATRRDSLIEADTTRRSGLSWPVVSPGADELQRRGFAHAPDGERGGRWLFYGPDASVLFADWFLAEHCFDVTESAPGSGAVTVTFEPIGRRDQVRVRGRLILDRSSLAVRELHFEHINLPSHLAARSAGGSVHFVADADGAWRPDRWVMRAPLEVVAAPPPVPVGSAPRGSPLARLPRVVGSVEVHGRVVSR